MRPAPATRNGRKRSSSSASSGNCPRAQRCGGRSDDLIAGSDDATGRLILETSHHGERHRALAAGASATRTSSRRLADLPMIHADATLPFDLVRNYLPNLQLACDLDIEAPHMRVTQVIRDAGRQVGAGAQAAGRAEGQAARRMDGDGRRGRREGCPQAATPGRRLPAPRTRPARPGHHLQGHRERLRRDRRRRGRPLRSHRRHRPLARCRRRGDHRTAAPQAGRHRTDGRRHYRPACHRRAYGRAARDDPRRPAGRADHQAPDLCARPRPR